MIPQFRPCVTHATKSLNPSTMIRKNWSNTIGSVKNGIATVWSVGKLTIRNRKTKMLHNNKARSVERIRDSAWQKGMGGAKGAHFLHTCTDPLLFV